MNISLETVLRCLDILPIIRENQGIALAELARRAVIDENVIVDQLIPALMLCGAPPYMPHDYVSIWLEGDKVFVGFADHFKRPVTLLPIEITALHLALSSSAFPGDDDPEVQSRFQVLREKVERALPREQRVFLEQTERLCLDDNPERRSPHLPRLKEAVANFSELSIDYLSFGDSTLKTRTIRPYGIIVRDGVTYIPSFDEKRGHVVSFRLDRVHSVEATGQKFAVDPAFNLEKYLRDGMYAARNKDEQEVKIRLKTPTARWVAEALDQRQLEWENHNTLIVTLSSSRPLGVVRWVMSLGPDAELLSPPELRQSMIDEIKKLQA